mgnify:FL=1
MKYLFIAEKPSLMRTVQSCYQQHKAEIVSKVGEIDFIAMAGHLCTNFMPDDYEDAPWSGLHWDEVTYPMVPDHWGIKPIENARSRKLLHEIAQKTSSYEGFIVGTDSDMEGYGIYFLLEHYLHLTDKKALRFMERSLTDKEILESLLSMTDFHSDPAHIAFTQSFLLRSRADWLYGMNLSRIMSVRLGSPMNIGRVKAPTMKLVYDNSMAIAHFTPEYYYIVDADYEEGFTATMLNPDDGSVMRFVSPETIPAIPLDGKIQQVEAKTTSTHAPQLYDLGALQAEAASQLHLTPTETLDIVQSLYEKHKCLSYPRTQCRYVSTEKAKEFAQFIEQAKVFPELSQAAASISDISFIFSDKKVVNDAEVAKESHDALLPTTIAPNLDAMTANERAVCLMVYTRMLAQFLPKLQEQVTQVLICHGKYLFLAKGKSILHPGWKILYGVGKEKYIPELSEGMDISAKSISPVRKVTTPPKRLTQATLLRAMITIASKIENPALRKSLADSKGIGTAATRAAIISELISKGYVEDKKKGLFITEKGKTYVENLEGIDILSPVFAAVLDLQIKKIQRQEVDFTNGYQNMLRDLHRLCKQVEEKPLKKIFSSYVCPCCGKPLSKERYSYGCICGFSIPSYLCGIRFSEKEIKDMLQGKTSGKHAFTKKDGSSFEAAVQINLKEKKVRFVNPDDKSVVCPICHANARMTEHGVFCDSCGLKLFRNIAKKRLSDRDLMSLIKKKETDEIEGFISKKGTPFSACLILGDDKQIHFSFQ